MIQINNTSGEGTVLKKSKYIKQKFNVFVL